MPPLVGIDPGDKLRADKVAVEAMKIGKTIIIQRTGGHKGKRCIAERNVECVVLKKMVIAKEKA